jgi:16S rRNA (guanine527-N7)-methyltransferase
VTETDELVEVLEEAQRLGFLGRRPVPDVIEHASGFLAPCADRGQFLDLGSGGGVPGLVVAQARPDARVVLLDRSGRRTDWLVRVVHRLGWHDRVTVLSARAEDVAREPAWRETQAAVLARGFGAPPVTAECAAALVAVGGVVVVSEPPDEPREPRWPPSMVDYLGLARRAWRDPAFAVLDKIAPCPDVVPRRSVLRSGGST